MHWIYNTGHRLLALGTSMQLLPAGDQHGNIRVWDLTANACSCELVPEVGTAVRSITVALDGSLVVAANNAGTCYVWRMMRGASLTTHFEPLHKLRACRSAVFLVLKCNMNATIRHALSARMDIDSRALT